MRIRTIKPEFYQDEALGQVPREVRLLAAALITWADDEGYFRTHPALIAGALFPFDSDGRAFVEEGLDALSAAGFVQLFEDGVGCLPGFTRHQVINRATDSRLKAKALKPLDSVNTHGGLSEDSLPEGKGSGREVEGKGTGSSAPPAHPKEHPLQAVWNSLRAPEQPEWLTTGRARKKSADARWREGGTDDAAREDFWSRVVRRLAASSFARGVTPGSNGTTWVANVEFLLREGSAAKVLEGNYDDRKAKANGLDPNQGIIRSLRPEGRVDSLGVA